MNYFIPLLIALVIGSTKEIFKKKILINIAPIKFIIIFYSIMFIFAQLTIYKISIPNLHGWILIFISSIFYLLSNLIGLRMLKELKISIIKPIEGLDSIFVLFMSFFILKEVLKLTQFIGIAIIITPLLYMFYKQYKKHAIKKNQIFLIFIGIFFASSTTIIDKLALKIIDPISYFYFLKLVLIVMFILVLFIFYKQRINFKIVKKSLLPISILAFFTMIGSYAYFFALNDPFANTGVTKTILSTSIIFSTFIGGKYFRENNLKEQVIISLFVILGINILVFF